MTRIMGGFACILTATECFGDNIETASLGLPAWAWVVAGLGWIVVGFALICGRSA